MAMFIGAHVREADPVASAAQSGAEIVQMFLADPQGWKKPPAHSQAMELREGPLAVVVHAPYVVNLASPNNRIRIPSRKLVTQHAEARPRSGPSGSWCTAGTSPRRTTPGRRGELAQVPRSPGGRGGFPVPMLIENTAGGDNAMARRFDALARLWDAVGEFDVGFCLDTCHAHAAARSWPTWSTGSRRSPAGSTWCTSTTPGTRSGRAPTGTRTSGRARSTRTPGRGVRRGRGAGRGRDTRGGPGGGHRVPARAARFVTP